MNSGPGCIKKGRDAAFFDLLLGDRLASHDAASSARADNLSEPINQNIKTQPDNVNEVPVPRSTFKSKVIVCREMALTKTQGDEQQHQHTNKHVETVKTRQHIKS